MSEAATVPPPRIDGSRALGLLSQECWLLRDSTLSALSDVLIRRHRGIHLSDAEVEGFIQSRDSRCEDRREQSGSTPQRPYAVLNGVAVIPVAGLLVKYANLVNGQSQPRGTSMQFLKRALRAAKNDEAVESILLDVDTPGGAESELAETGDLIKRIDERSKPVYALVEGGMMFSAGYWLAACTRQIFTTRTSRIGSIGVFNVLVDASQRAEDEGIRVHVLRYGDKKNMGHVPEEGVSEESIEHELQAMNVLGDMFVDAVRKGRGMSLKDAKAVADGAVHYAPQAKELGLVDQIVRDFDHAIQLINRSDKNTKGGSADGRTASSDQSQEKNMSEQQTPIRYESAAQLAEAQPELAAALRAEGASSERKRSAAIRSMAESGQESVLEACLNEDIDENEARSRLHNDLRNRLSERDREISERRGQVGEPDGSNAGNEAEFSDEAELSAGDDFESRVLADWKANKSGCQRKHSHFSTYLAFRENERNKEGSQ